MPEMTRNNRPAAQVNKTRDKEWISRSFSASALLFWIKGKVSVDYRFVRIVEQNTILGLIPAGDHKQNIPLKNISDVSVSTSYKIGRFVLGLLLALGGFGTLGSSFLFGLIMMVLGIGIFLNGIMTQFTIEKGGNPYVISVPFFNKQDILDVQDVIEQALTAEENKGDLSYYQKRLSDEDIDDQIR